jgi:hypothetical protein
MTNDGLRAEELFERAIRRLLLLVDNLGRAGPRAGTEEVAP